MSVTTSIATASVALARALADSAAEMEDALDTLLPVAEGDEARLYEAMRYSAMGGGKRMRAFLVLEGARQFNVSRTAMPCLHRAGR